MTAGHRWDESFYWFDTNTVRGSIRVFDSSGSGQRSVAGPCESVLNIRVSHMAANIYIKIRNPPK